MKHILYIAFLAVLCSCNNKSKKDKIMQEFDSAGSKLDELLASKPPDNMRLYDSLQRKWSDSLGKYGKVQQMYYTVNDFYGYLSEVRRKFKQFCGDSTGEQLPDNISDSVVLTRKFFLDKNSVASPFFAQLVSVTHHFNINASSETAYGMIRKLTSVSIERYTTADKFMEQYFKTTPPVAAITILNSFEAQVKNTELRILTDYLNQ